MLARHEIMCFHLPMPHDPPPRRSGKETEMAHTYHPHCGCYSCGLQEEAGERDEELRVMYLTALTACPDFLSEVPPNGEECAAMAAAINTGDMAELGRIFLRAAEREASEHVAVMVENCGITAGEAALRLWERYRPAPFDARGFAKGMEAGNESAIASALGVAA